MDMERLSAWHRWHVFKASLQAQIAQLFEVALRSTAGDLDGASLEPLVATADPRFGDYQCIMARKDIT